MKIGLLADIHGSINNLSLILNYFEEEEVDLVLIAGDIAATVNYKLIIRSLISSKKMSRSKYANYVYSSALNLFDAFQIKSLKKILEQLDNCSFPSVLISGNSETNNAHKFLIKEAKRRSKIYFIDNELLEIPNHEVAVVGYSGTTPAVYRRAFSSPGEKPLKQMRKELEAISKKANTCTVPLIFLTHDAPYGTKLDLIKERNEQGGNKAITEFIDRLQPLINVHGHIHENRGVAHLGKTLLINPGAVVDGRGALFETTNSRLIMLEGYSKGIKLLSFIYKIRAHSKMK